MLHSEDIKSLAHSTPTASAVFLGLSQRERPRRVLNIALFKRQLQQQNVDVNDKDFVTVFQALERMKVGNIVYRRKGNPDMFVWYYSLLDIAKIGLGAENVALSDARKEDRGSSSPPVVAMYDRKKLTKFSHKDEEPIKTSTGEISSNKKGFVTITIPIEFLKQLA